MITEDYVSFETAKLLKEKGFDIPCNAYFVEIEKETAKNKFNRRFCHSSVEANRNTYKSEMANHYYFSCPTIQMAMKWLREVHHIDICTEPHSYSAAERKTSNYEVSYWQEDKYVAPYSQRNHELSGKTWEKYEDACESAIKYCLESLI